jgi:hypothetical protein
VKSSQEVTFQVEDFLVVPETWVQFIKGKGSLLRKVIFNQNAYFTFAGGNNAWTPHESPYNDSKTIAAFVVSEDNLNYLSYVFPNLAIHRVRNVIDPKLFYYEPHKKNQIAYMPRKGAEFSSQILTCLKYREVLHKWNIVAIDNMSHADVARVMRESKIFLSFGYPEGFSLPPAEAMACGCIVIGYHGMGGREFFKDDFSFPIELGDIIGFAQAIEHVSALFDTYENEALAKGRDAARFIASTYTANAQQKEIIDFWTMATSLKYDGLPTLQRKDA